MKANQNATLNKDEGGQIAISGAVIGGLIVFAVALIVAANLIPDAVTEVETANQTGWSESAIGLWDILGLVIVAGVIMLVLRIVGIV